MSNARQLDSAIGYDCAMRRTDTHRLVFCLMAVGVVGLAVGCSRVISPTLVQDAQTAVRVKTALVNDAILGIRPIEVTVTNGIARLSGRVGSDAEAQHAAELSRSVQGVRDVRLDLRIGASGLPEQSPNDVPQQRAAPESPRREIPEDDEGDRRLLGMGLSVGRSYPRGRNLDPSTRVGPLIRLGSGTGLGWSVGFSWFHANVSPSLERDTLGRVRIRPVMGGLAYTLGSSRVSASLSLVGGVAFNSLSQHDHSSGPVWALDVGNSLAWRPGFAVWLDLNRRVAFNVFTGHVITRPRMTILEDGQVRTQILRGDATILNTGLVYKLF